MPETEASMDLDDIWNDDLLGRRSEADFLERFLVGRMEERRELNVPGSFVLNIDARWGAGKSFFLERFGRQLESHQHLVAKVNAWRDDHFDDPFISVLAAIDEALLPFTKAEASGAKRLWDRVKQGATPILGRTLAGVGKTVVKRYVGSDPEELIGTDTESEQSEFDETIQNTLDTVAVEIERVIDQTAEKLIKSFGEQNKAIEDFRGRLGRAVDALSNQRRLPLFVLIDELDRCRPSYAVALLERVKHLFDADNVVFVFATNCDQLQYSITGAYGSGFDGFRYLKRFFDRTYLLPNLSPEALVRSAASRLDPAKVRTPIEDPTEFLVAACNAYSMDLRQVKQVMDTILTVVSAWPFESKVDLVALFPLAAEFDRSGNVDWESANAHIPELEFDLGRRFNFETQREESQIISLKGSFNIIRNNLEIDKAKKLSMLQSHNSQYVYDGMLPEWNNKRVQYGQISNLSKLVDLVSLSGNMQS